MECLCTANCTIRINNKSVYVDKGQILEFEKCPPHHFQSLSDAEIDFATATEELLIRSKNWDLSDLMEFMERSYKYIYSGPPLTRVAAAQLLADVRMRQIQLPLER